jgi:hypothetical protein
MSGRPKGEEGEDIVPAPEPVDLAQKYAGEIKRDGADFAEALADLREKAEELEDPRQKGKAGRSLACMATIAIIAIFRGFWGFSGFAAFAKPARGLPENAARNRFERAAGGARRLFRGEGRAPPRRSRIRRERAKGFLPLSCKRSASS